MRLHPTRVLAVCLCLWIPVALTYGAVAPEDQDGSGDDEEFSGSGSGDDDMWLVNPEMTTQLSANSTKRVLFRDGPFIQQEHTVVHLNPEPETSGHTTEVPVPSTTETQPSTVSIKAFGTKEDHKEETTTIRDVAHPETTVPPVEKLPVVPTDQEVQTTSAHAEINITESSVKDQKKDGAGVLVEEVSLKTEAPDSETTTAFLSTTTASKIHVSEASGDAVESTTVQGIRDNLIEEAIFPVDRGMNEEITTDNGFYFGQKTKSNFARGNTDDGSILEKKEVLAGVIAGGVVGLAFAIMLVALMVYRMKKKDEGSYSLDEHKHPNGGYQKPQKQEEFLA